MDLISWQTFVTMTSNDFRAWNFFEVNIRLSSSGINWQLSSGCKSCDPVGLRKPTSAITLLVELVDYTLLECVGKSERRAIRHDPCARLSAALYVPGLLTPALPLQTVKRA